MMLVDCQTCPVRDLHCADCMVTALAPVAVPAPRLRSAGRERDADTHTTGLSLDRAERRAVSALLGAGLVTAQTAHTVRATVEHDRGPAQRREPQGTGRRAAG